MGKILVELSDFQSANKLIFSPEIKAAGLKAFITSFKLFRTGIIKDVSLELTDEDIVENIDSSIKVLEIQRLNRRVSSDDGSSNYILSRGIRIKFKGQSIPRYIFLFKIEYAVSSFIPRLKICYSCFRVGHISSSCKSKPRCLHCGSFDHDKENPCKSLNSFSLCLNCKGDHLATSSACEIIIKHKKIQALAATDNLPFFLAKKRVEQSHFSSTRADPRFDFSNFPALNSRRNASFESTNRFSVLKSSHLINSAQNNLSSTAPSASYASLFSKPKPPVKFSSNSFLGSLSSRETSVAKRPNTRPRLVPHSSPFPKAHLQDYPSRFISTDEVFHFNSHTPDSPPRSLSLPQCSFSNDCSSSEFNQLNSNNRNNPFPSPPFSPSLNPALNMYSPTVIGNLVSAILQDYGYNLSVDMVQHQILSEYFSKFFDYLNTVNSVALPYTFYLFFTFIYTLN
ncbi:uncharacterized protein [Cardiocondyla obscurior]|uniref:uncharacterized protein n=1 Tax=Cardiocondyla obscurior TaxID=286306 RepID=UPI0039657C8E